MKDEALKLALEALEDIFGKNKVDVGAINAIKQALAAPVQEPVAVYQTQHPDGSWLDRDEQAFRFDRRNWCNTRILYTTPPAAQLAAPVSEPMAFEKWWEDQGQFCRAGGGEYEKTFAFRAWEAALANPPAAQRTWVGLTDEEMYLNCPNWLSQEHCKVWIQQIEAKLKEKNT